MLPEDVRAYGGVGLSMIPKPLCCRSLSGLTEGVGLAKRAKPCVAGGCPGLRKG